MVVGIEDVRPNSRLKALFASGLRVVHAPLPQPQPLPQRVRRLGRVASSVGNRSGRPIGHGDGAQPHPKSAQGQCVLLPSCTEGADACKGCNTAVEKGCAMETVRARGSRWFGGGPDKLAGRVETATTTSTAYRGVGMEGCSRHAKVCKTRIRVAKSEAKRNIYGFSDSACDARV